MPVAGGGFAIHINTSRHRVFTRKTRARPLIDVGPARAMYVGMRESTKQKLTMAAYAVIILNLVDAIFTLVYVKMGMATEGNPLMDQVLGHSPVLFMLAKLVLVSAGVGLLWRLRHRRSAVTSLFLASGAYVVLLCYHLSAVPQLIAVASR